MSDKSMTDAEFKRLEKLYKEDMLNYNADTPLLFDEIRRLKSELKISRKEIKACLARLEYLQDTMEGQRERGKQYVVEMLGAKRAAELLRQGGLR